MPGRTRKRPARSDSWPCAVCSENCLLCSVQCNACKKWVHASCNGLTDKDLEYVSRNLPYMCTKCTLDADGGVYSYNSAMLRLRGKESVRFQVQTNVLFSLLLHVF